MSEISEKKKWTFLATSGAIALSKVFGFARDLLVAAFYGTGLVADSFNYAYLFTGNLFILFGGLNGPFHSATVTAFGRQSKPNVLAILFWSFAPLALLAFFAWLALSFGLAASFSPLLLENLKLMLPVLACTGLMGALFGVLCSRGNLWLPSLSPLLSSIATICVLLFGREQLGDLTLAWGILFGTFLQVLLHLFFAWREDLSSSLPNKFFAWLQGREEGVFFSLCSGPVCSAALLVA